MQLLGCIFSNTKKKYEIGEIILFNNYYKSEGGKRYYTSQQVELIKMIKFLLKNEGITISGVKKLLNTNVNKLDDTNKHSLINDYYKKYFKTKSKSILEKLNKIKNYGKKNSS